MHVYISHDMGVKSHGVDMLTDWGRGWENQGWELQCGWGRKVQGMCVGLRGHLEKITDLSVRHGLKETFMTGKSG